MIVTISNKDCVRTEETGHFSPSERQLAKFAHLDVGESGVTVGEVDPARDAVKVGLGDDLDELADAPLGVDVLDVGLVLGG